MIHGLSAKMTQSSKLFVNLAGLFDLASRLRFTLLGLLLTILARCYFLLLLNSGRCLLSILDRLFIHAFDIRVGRSPFKPSILYIDFVAILIKNTDLGFILSLELNAALSKGLNLSIIEYIAVGIPEFEILSLLSNFLAWLRGTRNSCGFFLSLYRSGMVGDGLFVLFTLGNLLLASGNRGRCIGNTGRGRRTASWDSDVGVLVILSCHCQPLS